MKNNSTKCGQCGRDFPDDEIHAHLLGAHGLSENPRLTLWGLVALEAVLLVAMVAAYYVGLSLGAASIESWWVDAQRALALRGL